METTGSFTGRNAVDRKPFEVIRQKLWTGVESFQRVKRLGRKHSSCVQVHVDKIHYYIQQDPMASDVPLKMLTHATTHSTMNGGKNVRRLSTSSYIIKEIV